MSESDWRVILLRSPRRYLDTLGRSEQTRILDALSDVERDPFSSAMKHLHGRPEWSLRVGGFRILLRVDRETRQLVVTRIGPRGGAYKH